MTSKGVEHEQGINAAAQAMQTRFDSMFDIRTKLEWWRAMARTAVTGYLSFRGFNFADEDKNRDNLLDVIEEANDLLDNMNIGRARKLLKRTLAENSQGDEAC